MHKSDLEQLCADRIADAKALLDSGRWSAAYYLAGYAVECAIKACVAKLVRAGDFPDKRLADKSWIHNIDKLLDAAELRNDLDIDMRTNANLEANWTVTVNWSEQSRYLQTAQNDAQELFRAITDPQDGVLPWVKTHW